MNEPSPHLATDLKSVIGRLAKHPYLDGDPLPEVGALCLVSGANADVESDQHRSYQWLKVIGYTDDNHFVCLQKPGCWPTVERLSNCWFADEESLVKAAAPELLAVCRRLRAVINEHVSLADVDALDAAIAKAEGRANV